MHVVDVLCYDKDGSEAEVSISDGRYTVKCYAYPCDRRLINQHVSMIYGFECVDIIRANENQYAINKLAQHYAYQLVAQVVDRETGLVCVGNLFICLDNPIPKDMINGEYISFSVLRLDCD